MADTATSTESKGKAAKKGKAAEETKLTLPTGHPQAGYVPPDLSFRDGAGESDEEQDALDEQIAERDELVAAVEEHEHEVATEEREAALAEAEPKAKDK